MTLSFIRSGSQAKWEKYHLLLDTKVSGDRCSQEQPHGLKSAINPHLLSYYHDLKVSLR